MFIVKVAALALILCVLSLILKREQPAFAFLASVCGTVILLVYGVEHLLPLAEWLHTLNGYGFAAEAAILLQVLGIALVAQFACDLCREAGLAAAASAIDLCGRMLILVQAVPLLQSLLQSFSGFLQS